MSWPTLSFETIHPSLDGNGRVGRLADLRDEHLRQAATEGFGRYGVPLLDLLAKQTLVAAAYVVERLRASPTTIGGLLDKPSKLGIIEEVTGQKRNWVYRCSPLLDLFTSDEPSNLSLRFRRGMLELGKLIFYH